MALTECPHCGEKKSGRHVRFCPKNPGRQKGKPIQSVAAPVVEARQPEIVAEVKTVPVEKLPTFAPPPAPKQKAGAVVDPTQPPVITSAELMRPIVDLVLDRFEKKLDELEPGHVAKTASQRPEPLTEKDRHALSTVYGLVLDKYLPETVMRAYGLEVSAVVLTLFVVVPKVLEYRDYWKAKQKMLKAEREQIPKETGFTGQYQLQNANPDALKEAYDRAVAQGRIPA
jgi:hypothetical protein